MIGEILKHLVGATAQKPGLVAVKQKRMSLIEAMIGELNLLKKEILQLKKVKRPTVSRFIKLHRENEHGTEIDINIDHIVWYERGKDGGTTIQLVNGPFFLVEEEPASVEAEMRTVMGKSVV